MVIVYKLKYNTNFDDRYCFQLRRSFVSNDSAGVINWRCAFASV